MNWGSNGIFIGGVSIPDSGAIPRRYAKEAGHGYRLGDPTTPGLVFKEGKPILGFSSIGSGLINQSFTALLNVLDYDMTPQEATAAPSFGQFSYQSRSPALLVEPGRISEAVVDKVKRFGAKFVESTQVRPGFWNAIYRDYKPNGISSTEEFLQ